MTTKEIASRLVELCRKGDFETAQKELFSNDAVSIEPFPSDGFSRETKGLDNIIAKGERFNSMVETMHSFSVGEPVIAANSFAVIMGMDVTMKEKGRMNMSELCVYEIKDGKIISEQFHM